MSPEKRTKEHSVLAAIQNQSHNIQAMQASIANEKVIHGEFGFDEQTYLEQNFGFMADAIAEAGGFTLQPNDIINVWSKTSDMFSYYQRHALSGIISAAYCVQLFRRKEWKMFPRIYNSGIDNTFEFLSEINPTDKEFQRILSRYQDLTSSVRELQKTNRSLSEQGTPNPVIGEAIENFGNGMNSIKLLVDYFQG